MRDEKANQVLDENNPRRPLWVSLIGYLACFLTLAAGIILGNLQIEEARNTGDDFPMFLGIFSYMTGGLISISGSLSFFVTGRQQKG